MNGNFFVNSTMNRYLTRIYSPLVILICLLTSLYLWHTTKTQGRHLHDIYHYYIGAKYFEYTGYDGLYAASRQALQEEAKLPPHLRVRDLDNKLQYLDEAHLTTLGMSIKGTMGYATWEAFKRDILTFDKHFKISNVGWKQVFLDYGFNPSPIWMLYGKPIAESVSIQDNFDALVILDLILLSLSCVLLTAILPPSYRPPLALLFWAFLLFFPSGKLAFLSWMGNSFLRFSWFFFLCLGIWNYQKNNFAIAGFFLALSALERVFPVILVFGLFVSLLVQRDRKIKLLSPNSEARKFAQGALFSSSIALSLSLLCFPIDKAIEWPHHIIEHSQNNSSNRVGFNILGSYVKGAGINREWRFNDQQTDLKQSEKYQAALSASLDAKNRSNYTAKALEILISCALLYAFLRCPKTTNTYLISLSVIYFASNLSHYYYVITLPWFFLMTSDWQAAKGSDDMARCLAVAATFIMLNIALHEESDVYLNALLMSAVLLFLIAILAGLYIKTLRFRAYYYSFAILMSGIVYLRANTLNDENVLYGYGRNTLLNVNGKMLTASVPKEKILHATYLEMHGGRLEENGYIMEPSETISLPFKLNRIPENGVAMVIRSDFNYPVTLNVTVNGHMLDALNFPQIGGIFVDKIIPLASEGVKVGDNTVTVELANGHAFALFHLWMIENRTIKN